jgi:hypothetical protein
MLGIAAIIGDPEPKQLVSALTTTDTPTDEAYVYSECRGAVDLLSG